jgi:hypothetical protein
MAIGARGYRRVRKPRRVGVNAAVYHRTATNVRVCYVSNGRWTFQRDEGVPSDKSRRECDRWVSRGAPTTRESAVERMNKAAGGAA